jgi:hypothetical protein
MVFALGRGGPDRADALRAELAGLVDAPAPWAVDRNMVDFVSRDDAPDAAGAAAVFGPEHYARLAEVKRRHDPSSLFRFHRNVPPASHRPARRAGDSSPTTWGCGPLPLDLSPVKMVT